MHNLPNHDNCYGCGACANICPKKCISMQINQYGELRPNIDLNSCINCHICEKICPVLNHSEFNTPQDVYSLTITDFSHKNGSASGGAARLLYEEALKNNYIVYGCSFDEQYILNMQQADSIKEIDPFRNSKYTFCRMNDTFNKIKKQLSQNKKVLFIGTSCQVAAMKSFLGKIQSDNLILVDLICHGVPPESYFREYVNNINNKTKKPIENIKFRGNERSKDYYLRLFINNKCIYDKYAREDLFFAGYVNYIIFEKKCYHCPFAKGERISDITIGDWWGKTHIKGKQSLIFANTNKGIKFVDKIIHLEDIIYEKHTLEEAVTSNEQLSSPSKMPENYKEMREYYVQYGFMKMGKKYINPYIKKYKYNKRKRIVRYYVTLPIRVLRKIKRVVIGT